MKIQTLNNNINFSAIPRKNTPDNPYYQGHDLGLEDGRSFVQGGEKENDKYTANEIRTIAEYTTCGRKNITRFIDGYTKGFNLGVSQARKEGNLDITG